MSKTVLIMNGLTLDKGEFNDILKKIAGDRHIWYAMDYIRRMNRNSKAIKTIKDIIDFMGIAKAVDVLQIASLPLLAAKKITEYVSEKLPDCAKSESTNQDFEGKTNFDYWKLFLSNLSDTQTLLPAFVYSQAKSRPDEKVTVKQLFCALPYYKNKYIDALRVEITLNNNKGITAERVEALIHSHIISVSYAACIREKLSQFAKVYSADNELQSEIERIISGLSDRSVFGLTFLSGLLKELYDNDDIVFEFSSDLLKNENNVYHLNDDGVFIRELIMQAGNPGKVKLCKELAQDPNKNIIKVIGLDQTTSREKKKNSIRDLFIYTDENKLSLCIPIKRIISVPVSYLKQMQTINYMLEHNPCDENIYPLPECFKKDDVEIFSIGGGEHNLPLVHLINLLRYKYRDERHFGFIENAFDLELKRKTANDFNCYPEFLIGLETAVKGVNRLIRQRETVVIDEQEAMDANLKLMDLKSMSHVAEILSIEYDYADGGSKKKICGYAVYGFSAAATRFALLGLLYALDEQNDKAFSDAMEPAKKGKFHRSEYISFSRQHLLLYSIGESRPEFFNNILPGCDTIDIMNNSEEDFPVKLIINNLYLGTAN